jgi:small-conductance mechanosensitive channel
MSPPPVVSQSVPLPGAAREFFEGLASVEGRLAVTAGIVLLTLIVAVLLLPRAVRGVNAALASRIPKGRLSSALERIGGYVPTTAGGFVLRAIQVVLVVFAVVSLLVVWGLVGVAVDVLVVLGLSIPILVKIAATVGLAFVAYVASDVIADTVARFSQGNERVTEHQEEIILRIGNLAVLALAIASTLTVWEVNLSGLLVGAGFLGIVVGLAARQTLGSLIAGFVLMFSRPFTIGDWVEIGDDEGIVTDITIVNTRLENFDGETVVIPNDRVSNQPITNRSERGHLRIRMDVGVDYATDPDRAVEVAQSAIDGVAHVTDAPPPQVLPKSFGDSAVVLELRFWIDQPMPPKKWRAISEVVGSVKAAFDDAGIKIPFPQRELSGRAETGGFRLNEESPAPQGMGERSVEPGAGE